MLKRFLFLSLFCLSLYSEEPAATDTEYGTKRGLSLSYFNVLSDDSPAIIAAETTGAPETPDCGHGAKHMRISARHIEGKGVGYNRGYTTLEAFLAPDPEKFSVMPFIDLRGHLFNNEKWAANAGLGARWRRGTRIYGANVFYDYRDDRKAFNQIGFGLETLGKIWDVRLNGYFPFGNKITRPYHTRFDYFTGNELILSRKYEFTMQGFDAEAGGHINVRNFDVFAGIGPYYFNGKIGTSTWGGKARVSATWKEYIGLQLSGSYDHLFRGIVQGEVTFSYPFGPRSTLKSKNNACYTAKILDRRMVQPVVRDEIIVLSKLRKTSPAINPATGQPFVFLFVDNTSHSLGTYESPFNTLAAAETASSAGDIIYVFPGDGTDTGMSSGITLQDNQQLLGATLNYDLLTTVGMITVPAQALGANFPVLTNGASDVIILGNGNVVSGLTILNTAGRSLFGNAITNCTLTQNNIQGLNIGNGIELDNATGAIIVSGNFISNENYCFFVSNSSPLSASYTVTGNTMINGAFPLLFDFTDTTGTWTMTGNTFVSGDNGIHLVLEGASQVVGSINNNSFIGAFYHVNLSTSNTSTVSGNISDNTFTAMGDDDVILISTQDSSSISNFSVLDNSFSGYYYNGIDVELDSSGLASLTLGSNTFTDGPTSAGILAASSGTGNSVLSILANTFDLAATNAIAVSQSGSGILCLELNSNIANLFPTAYSLQQTAGTFNLQPLVGNIGQISTMGVITPVASCQ